MRELFNSSWNLGRTDLFRLVRDQRYSKLSFILGLLASTVGAALVGTMAHYWSPPEIRRRLTLSRWEAVYYPSYDPKGFGPRQLILLDAIESFSIFSGPKLVTGTLFQYESNVFAINVTFIAWNPLVVRGFLLETPGHTFQRSFTEFDVDDFLNRARQGKEIAFEAVVQINDNPTLLPHLEEGCKVYLIDQNGNRLSPPVSLQIIPRIAPVETDNENTEPT